MSFIQRVPLGDRLLAAAAVLLAVAYTAFPGNVAGDVAVVQAIVSWCFVPFFLLWRTKPGPAATGMLACLGVWAVTWFMQLPYNAGLSPWLIAAPMAVFTTARFCADRKVPWAVLGVTFTGAALSPAMWMLASDLTVHYRQGRDIAFGLAFHWLLLTCTFFAATHLRDKELERARQDREARKEERLLISRELHDVLAHSLTLMKVQAHAGLIDHTTAIDTLAAIRDEADGALTEVRAIVSALRSDESATRKPQQQVAAIGEIIEGFRAVGLSITATIPQQIPTLTALAQLALTRITSEALTNVLRHQGASARAEVTLKFADSAHITVESWGSEQGKSAGCGAGLTGLKERAEALGGLVDTKGNAAHFLLTAEIPIRSTL